MEVIKNILNALVSKHEECSSEFAENRIDMINLKKVTVLRVVNKPELFKDIMNYHNFLNDRNLLILDVLESFKSEQISITARVKARNSILSKLERYNGIHGTESVPINKCLNDLFGVRMVVDDVLYEEMMSFIEGIDDNKLKSRNADKDEYKAHHINIKQNNFTYEWELQIWKKSDEESNYKSHSTYKQEYTKWESQE